MVSNIMAKKLFGHSIGGGSGSAPINTKSVDGIHQRERVRNSGPGFPVSEPARPLAEGKPVDYRAATLPKPKYPTAPKGGAGKMPPVKEPGGR
jgi:hypothetical protein